VQAARRVIAERTGSRGYVLGEVRALRYGSFVRPGDTLRVTVTVSEGEDGVFKCKGEGLVIRPMMIAKITDHALGEKIARETAVSGRFTIRPLRLPDH